MCSTHKETVEACQALVVSESATWVDFECALQPVPNDWHCKLESLSDTVKVYHTAADTIERALLLTAGPGFVIVMS